MLDRKVVIEKTDEIYVINATFEFDSKAMKDSEALHRLLCEYNPGEEYTVTFKSIKSSFCDHGFEAGNCVDSNCPHYPHF